MSDAVISHNAHGKGRVRFVKVNKKPDGWNEVQQYNVQVILEGDNMAHVFYTGDNKPVIPTDTCKNTVYCVASQNNFDSIEEYGVILAKHFLTEYPSLVNKVTVDIVEDNWVRLDLPDSKGRKTAHKHAFKRMGPQKHFTKVTGQKRPSTKISIEIQSGFRDLEVLKTTMSGFVDFHRCRYTSLPDVDDRLLATSVTATWDFKNDAVANTKIDFNGITKTVEDALVTTFAGPSDTGVYSPSVQQTMWEMGEAVLKRASSIQRIALNLPNIHNIPFPLENYGFSNKDFTGYPYIFYPIDEPHGSIRCTVERSNSGRARL